MLYLLYSQFSLFFQFFSSFCIFRVYFSSILWIFSFFLNSRFFTVILGYFQFFYIFHIFRFYYIFYILEFSRGSLLLCFSYVLYFEFPLPAPIGFLSRKCFMWQFLLPSWRMFLIPVMVKDWWFLWLGIHQNEWLFYDLIPLKLQYILRQEKVFTRVGVKNKIVSRKKS